MERRLLLAILLTFVVLWAYQTWLAPKPLPPAAPSTASGGATPKSAGSTQSATASSTAAPPLPPVEAVLAETAEKTVVVNNGVVRAVFSNRGGTLISWQLMKYQDSVGRPLDLIPRDLPATAPRPFSFKLEDPAKTARVNEALYAISPAGDALAATSAPATLTFEYQDVSGLHVRKEFRLEPNSYVVSLSATVTDANRTLNPAVELGPGPGDVLAIPAGGRNVRRAEGIYNIGGKVTRPASSALTTTPRYEGAYEFAGVDTHYFISVAVKPGAAALDYHPLTVEAPNVTPPISRDLIAYSIKYAQPPAVHAVLYRPQGAGHAAGGRSADGAGHLVRHVLVSERAAAVGAELDPRIRRQLRLVDPGADAHHQRGRCFPLRHKSFVSMRKMQEIQPQVKTIQDRYAKLKMTDPARQKMNTELMELYRQKGVNPASGCVPMLLTLPGAARVLRPAVGSDRAARRAVHVVDSRSLGGDPYYVTPILMGASQIVQQRMTPVTGAIRRSRR